MVSATSTSIAKVQEIEFRQPWVTDAVEIKNGELFSSTPIEKSQLHFLTQEPLQVLWDCQSVQALYNYRSLKKFDRKEPMYLNRRAPGHPFGLFQGLMHLQEGL